MKRLSICLSIFSVLFLLTSPVTAPLQSRGESSVHVSRGNPDSDRLFPTPGRQVGKPEPVH
jgi:hypothetical protein